MNKCLDSVSLHRGYERHEKSEDAWSGTLAVPPNGCTLRMSRRRHPWQPGEITVQRNVGECGGAAMCGTCHVLVDEPWGPQLPAMQRNEDELLDCTAAPREPCSRLSCQLRMTDALDGLSLTMPERQV